MTERGGPDPSIPSGLRDDEHIAPVARPALERALRAAGIVVREPSTITVAGRYWKGAAVWRGRHVFLKAAADPKLRAALRLENLVTRELRIAGVAVTEPLLIAEEDGITVLGVAFEAGVLEQSGGGRQVASLTPSQASGVAVTLARLAHVDPARVPSAPRPRAASDRQGGPNGPADALLTAVEHSLGLIERGEDLRAALGGLDTATVRSATRALAERVASLPSVGPPLLVHGDASPANTAFRADGTAVMFDWEWCRVEPTRTYWIGIDVMNYVTRSWANPAFGRALLRDLAARLDAGGLELISFRAGLVVQTLNKLGPSALYPEPKRAAVRARTEILASWLALALKTRTDILALGAG